MLQVKFDGQLKAWSVGVSFSWDERRMAEAEAIVMHT